MRKNVVIEGSHGHGIAIEYNGCDVIIAIIDGDGKDLATVEIQKKEFGKPFSDLIDATENILANMYRVEYYNPVNDTYYTREIEAASQALATTKFLSNYPGFQIISITNVYLLKKKLQAPAKNGEVQ